MPIITIPSNIRPSAPKCRGRRAIISLTHQREVQDKTNFIQSRATGNKRQSREQHTLDTGRPLAFGRQSFDLPLEIDDETQDSLGLVMVGEDTSTARLEAAGDCGMRAGQQAPARAPNDHSIIRDELGIGASQSRLREKEEGKLRFTRAGRTSDENAPFADGNATRMQGSRSARQRLHTSAHA
jgi:hypothetical protein